MVEKNKNLKQSDAKKNTKNDKKSDVLKEELQVKRLQKCNTLLYGAPKTGKTKYIVERLIQLSKERKAGEYFVVLVPDQFKLETERMIVENLGSALLFVKVMSLSKLAERVLKEAGVDDFTPISTMGKQLLVRDILRAKKSELKYFTFHSSKMSFISELVRLLGEMSAEITLGSTEGGEKGEVPVLDEIQSNSPSLNEETQSEIRDKYAVNSSLGRSYKRLVDKVHDINLIYREYQFRMDNSHVGDTNLSDDSVLEEKSDNNISEKCSEIKVENSNADSNLNAPLVFAEKSGMYMNDEKFVRLASVLTKDSAFIENSYFFVDNYDFFTQNEQCFFEEIAQYSKETWIAVHYDEFEPKRFESEGGVTLASYFDNPLFAYTKRLVDALPKGFARKRFQNLDKSPFESLSYGLFFQELALVSDAKEHVSVDKVETRYDEVVFVAKKIRDLVASVDMQGRDTQGCELEGQVENVSPSEIAVVCPSLDAYTGIVDHVFSGFGIPFFIDSDRNFSDNPLAEFLDGLLEYQVNKNSSEPVMRMLRSGIFPMSDNETLRARILVYENDISQNYVLGYGRNKGFEGESLKMDGSAENTSVEVEVSEAGNALIGSAKPDSNSDHEIEERLLNILNHLRFDNKEAGREVLGKTFHLDNFVRVLYWLLTQEYSDEQYGITYRSIKEICENHSFVVGIINGEATEEKDYGAKIWNALMSILEELSALSDTVEQQDCSSVRSLLDIGFSKSSIGRVPRYRDYVTIAPIGRARAHSLKYTFVLGALRKELPAIDTNQVIFNLVEQGVLEEQMAPLNRSMRFQFLQDREKEAYHLHMLLTSPSERIRFTYPTAVGSPSIIIEMIEEAEEHIQGTVEISETYTEKSGKSEKYETYTEKSENLNTNEELEGVQCKFDFCRACDSEESVSNSGGSDSDTLTEKPYFMDIATHLEGVEDYLKRASVIRNTNYPEKDTYDLRLSATSIMKYLSCPFCFLVGDILRPKEIRKKQLGALETGNIIHRVLEEYVKKYYLEQNFRIGEGKGALQNQGFKSDEFFEKPEKFREGGSFLNDKNHGFSNDVIFSEKECVAENYDKEISENNIEQIASNIANDHQRISMRVQKIIDSMDDILDKNKMPDFRRNSLYYSRFLEACVLFVSAMVYQIETGKFKPYGVEYKISYTQQIEGLRIHFNGRMDRVDVARDNEKTYYRIIDYKTGAANSTIANIENHNYIQMAFYMNAIRTIEKLQKMTPSMCSGMYIFSAKESNAENDGKKEYLQTFQRIPFQGITLYDDFSRMLQNRYGDTDNTIIKYFDIGDNKRHSKNYFYRLAAQVEDGDLESKHPEYLKELELLKTEQEISEFIERYILETVKGIKNGEFPAKRDEKKCVYCKRMGIYSECFATEDEEVAENE